MKYLYLGIMYDRNREQELLSLSARGLSAAANEYQWNNYDGLCDLLGEDLSLVHALPVGVYPRHFRQLWLKKRTWTYRGTKASEMGGINLPVLKQLGRRRSCAAQIRRWLKEDPSEQHTVILYSLYLPYLQALRDVRRTNPDLQVIVNIPDMPGKYGILPSNPLKAMAATWVGNKALNIAKTMDGFVFLTQQMADILQARPDQYTVVEGICRPTAGTETALQEAYEGPDAVLYTGTLAAQFGLTNLLDAFEQLEHDKTELWICGTGAAEAEIRRRAEENPRIRYFGFCSRDTVHSLQQQAAVLVNPRPAEGEYTKYSFPSKTIEYLCAGTPVVMHRLEGIPEEYENYVIFTKESTAAALRDALDRALSMDPDRRRAWGLAARDFVTTKKSPRAQGEKIIALARSLCTAAPR